MTRSALAFVAGVSSAVLAGALERPAFAGAAALFLVLLGVSFVLEARSRALSRRWAAERCAELLEGDVHERALLLGWALRHCPACLASDFGGDGEPHERSPTACAEAVLAFVRERDALGEPGPRRRNAASV